MSEKEGCTQGLVNYATIWHFWHLWQELLLRWRVLCSTRTCWPCWRACSAVAWSLPLLPSAGRATSTACLASEPLSTVPQLILLKSGSRRGWTAAGSASRRSWTHRTRRWRRWSGWSDCRASTGQEAAQSSSFYQADSSMRPSAGHKKRTTTTTTTNPQISTDWVSVHAKWLRPGFRLQGDSQHRLNIYPWSGSCDHQIFRTCLGTTRCALMPTTPTQTCCRRCQTGRSHRNEQNQGKQRREKTLQQRKKCPQWTDLAKPTSSQNQEKNWALCWNLKSSVRFLLEWTAPKKGDNISSPHLAPYAPPRYCYTSCQNRRDIWSWHQLWMSTNSKYISIKINRHKPYCSSLGGRLFRSTFKKGAFLSLIFIHSLCLSKRP